MYKYFSKNVSSFYFFCHRTAIGSPNIESLFVRLMCSILSKNFFSHHKHANLPGYLHLIFHLFISLVHVIVVCDPSWGIWRNTYIFLAARRHLVENFIDYSEGDSTILANPSYSYYWQWVASSSVMRFQCLFLCFALLVTVVKSVKNIWLLLKFDPAFGPSLDALLW